MCMLSCSVMSSSLLDLYLARLFCPWHFPGENTGVGCHFLLQGIFLTQESNPCLWYLLHWQADSLPLSHLGSPPIEMKRVKQRGNLEGPINPQKVTHVLHNIDFPYSDPSFARRNKTKLRTKAVRQDQPKRLVSFERKSIIIGDGGPVCHWLVCRLHKPRSCLNPRISHSVSLEWWGESHSWQF